MDSPRRQLEIALAPLLRAEGYRKRALTWHRERPDTISVFNVQKSQWGDQFYVNCAIYLKALGKEKTPPEYRCHLRVRLDELVRAKKRLNNLLDFDKSIPQSKRLPEITNSVSSYALPWLRRYSDLAELRSLVVSDEAGRVPIVGTMRDYFRRAARRK